MERATRRGGGVDPPPTVPGFAPSDPTDGRELLDWQSRYEPEAWKTIWSEALYLGILLVAAPLGLVVFWLQLPQQLAGLSDEEYAPIRRYSLAWIGGTLGGTLFDVKWLYHTVARGIWSIDRRLWRLFTPHISGGLAFAVVALISSGVFRVFDPQAVNSLSLVVAVGFIVGYFSDSAVAKLREIAEILFGASRGKEKHREETERGATTEPSKPSPQGNSGSESKSEISQPSQDLDNTNEQPERV